MAVTKSGGVYYLTRGDSSFTSYTTCATFCQNAFTIGVAGGTAFWVKCYTIADNLNSNQVVDINNKPSSWLGIGNNITDCYTRVFLQNINIRI